MLGQAQPRATAQSAGTGIIRGRVVMSTAGAAPIADARVSIAGPTTKDPVFSDDLGRFEFSGLAAGRYTLTAEKTGFVKTRYGSKSELDVPQPIDVAVAAAVEGLQISMPKGAAISGVIVDELGDPVVAGTVSAGVLQAAGLSSRIVTVRTSSTNDRGEFRIGGLAAGRYYVSVDGSSEQFNITQAPPEWARSFTSAKTYYLASPTLTGASPIVLGAGEERGGVDFAAIPAQPAKLSLSLTDPSGAPAQGLINLLLPGESPGSVLSNRGVPFGPTNQKITSTLEPGEWVAVALVGQGRALAHIKISSGDDLAVTLRIGSGARLSGRVIFEGSSPPPALTSVRLAAQGVGLDTGVPGLTGGPGMAKADGTFEMTGVIGTIQLRPAPPIPGWILHSLTFGNRDLLDQPLTLGEGDDVQGIQVVFTDQLAGFSGEAITPDRRPAAGCTIAVFPERGEVSFDSRRARLVRADQNGTFRVPDLSSGSYLVAATPDVDVAAWMTPEYLNRLRAAAVPIALSDREQKTATLSCVSLQ